MEIGNRIGPYEIREMLGRGGMAQVWKAWHLGLHRFEALKIPVLRQADPAGERLGEGHWREGGQEFIARFLHEARIAAGLSHRHIATIYSVSEADAPRPFFAMELVEGGDLAALIHARGRLRPDEALPILEAVASALDYAHARGVVHRDIKPANVLLEASPDGWSPKVVDFGIARALQSPLESASNPDASYEANIAGTPEYMSPEQAGSGEKVGPRSDGYSLAVVAYEMLCGRPPFSSSSGARPISILVQHRIEIPSPPSTWHSDLPPALDDVLSRALAKSPAQRPTSCTEFVDALRAACYGSQALQVLGYASQGASTPSSSTWGHVAEAQAEIPLPDASESIDSSLSPPTIVQPPSVTQALALRAPTPSAQKMARKDHRGPALRWLVPASAVGALSVGAALVTAEMNRPAPPNVPLALPPSTSQSIPEPTSISGASEDPPLDPGADEQSANTAASTNALGDVETVESAVENTTNAVAETAVEEEEKARREWAEQTAQRARREKIEVIDSLLVLRRRQEADLLRPDEATASRRRLLGRLSRALTMSESALKVDADNETAWEQRASLLFLMGRFEKAHTVATQGLKKFPDNPDLKDARAKAGARLDRPEQQGA